MKPRGMLQHDGLAPVALFVVALGLRIAHLVTILDSPFFERLGLDLLAYDTWGMEIASGNWLGDRVFFQDPLYSYFLGLLYAVFGHRYVVAIVVQMVLGSLVAPMVFDATRRHLGKSAAWAAGILAATYAPSIYFDGLILKTWMGIFLVAEAMWALSIAVPGLSPKRCFPLRKPRGGFVPSRGNRWRYSFWAPPPSLRQPPFATGSSVASGS